MTRFYFFYVRNILFVLLFFLLINGCAKKQDTLLEDMAVLDLNYISTLLIARDMNTKNTQLAISNFVTEWYDFKKMYYNINQEDRQWQSDFDSLQDLLLRSQYFAASGEDVSASYLILHDVKYVLSDLRRRNNIEWFVDNLAAVYKTAYRMQELSRIYKGGDITEAEQARLQSVFNLLYTSTERCISYMDKSNLELFSLDNTTALQENLLAIDDLVANISLAVYLENYENIPSMCETIIMLYFNILSLISKTGVVLDLQK